MSKRNKNVFVIIMVLVGMSLSGCVSQKEFDALQLEKNSIQAQYDKMAVEYDASKADNDKLQSENQELKRQIEDYKRIVEQMQTENSQLNETVRSLRGLIDYKSQSEDEEVDENAKESLLDGDITNFTYEINNDNPNAKHSQEEIDALKEDIKENVEVIKDIVKEHWDGIKNEFTGNK